MSLYDVLQTPVNSTKKELKIAYMRLALQLHPDKKKDGNHEFVTLTKAYNILSDEHKRNFYDIMGDAWIPVLSKEKESYVLVRLFDKINLILYCLFLISFVLIITLIPIAMHVNRMDVVAYCMIPSHTFLLLTVIRNMIGLPFKHHSALSLFSLRYLIITTGMITQNFYCPLVACILDVFITYGFIQYFAFNVVCNSLSQWLCDVMLVVFTKTIMKRYVVVILIYIAVMLKTLLMSLDVFVLILMGSFISYYFLVLYLVAAEFNIVVIACLYLLFIAVTYTAFTKCFYYVWRNMPVYNPVKYELENCKV